MNNWRRILSARETAVVLVIGLAIGSVMTGCEGSGDALNVYPVNSGMGTNVTTVSLSVVSSTKEIVFPLEWSVSNPALGSITSTSGYSAVYTRTAVNGMNNITVRDQNWTEGKATVNQVGYATGQPAISTNASVSVSG